MELVQRLVPAYKYNIKCPFAMQAEAITVHNTANDACASDEVAYLTRNDLEVSFHIAVDDVEAIQAIPFNRNAWHAGDGKYGKGNRKTIAIEICYSKSGGVRFDKAEINAAKLIAQLLKERGWGIDKVTKHQDYSGKYCPHRTLDKGWTRFLNMVCAELDILNGHYDVPETSTGVEHYSGYVEITYAGADGVSIHNVPSWDSSTVSGVVHKGEVFTVVGRVKVNGVYMYKIKSGNYITSAKEYVAYKKTLNGSAESTPVAPTNPVAAEAAKFGYKVGTKDTVTRGFFLSEAATIYGRASYGVKIPQSVKNKPTYYTCGGTCYDRGEWWVLAKEIMSWVKVSETIVK